MATDLISNLQAIGWTITPMGGNCRAMRKGNALISGIDGDLPYPDWWIIVLHADWQDPDSVIWTASSEDWGGDLGDIDRALEALATRQGEA